MCCRFTLFEADKILSKEFGVSGIPTLSPRYNIASSQSVATVRATPAGNGRSQTGVTSYPPGNQLEALKEDRKGQHSIRINYQYRVCSVWRDDGPNRVEITDYH